MPKEATKAQEIEESKVLEVEEEPIEDEDKLAFANAQVVRIMRKNLAEDKMIRSDVKVAMNKFLEDMCANISQRMNKYPYAMIDMRMFNEAIEPYTTLEKVAEEKKRIMAHMEAIKADINKLQRDVEETFVVEE
ncbi:MAG: NFYB/HAP3 family transcription factor subunit [Candidatus Diapherotrites archaeon]|nr:NFYB/HAP3 family transcription factor subunit [Candidatus Diapherotrites archaeon]